MTNPAKLTHPWMVAVWPGMGNVAVSAGYYLMAKMGMHVLSEYRADELFDIDHVEVQDGVIQPSRLPRCRLFAWTDPDKKHDILVFIGEAQPPIGKHTFCRNLVEFAMSFGVEKIITFAAMATQMRPEQPSRVFCAATSAETLHELMKANLTTLENGHIGGLNGVLLGAALDHGVPGSCLLGEMPHVFAQLPYPKASLAVLKAFSKIAEIECDLDELTKQAEATDAQLIQLLTKMEAAIAHQAPEEEGYEVEDDRQLSLEDEQRIEELFSLAKQDQSRAYELKQELDRLDVFQDYEDRFLDLFKKPD